MYYGDKRESKVNICHTLQELDWTIYGYHADQSDSMTDYYCPASWEGIATKNGYTLCIDVNYILGYSGKAVERYTRHNINFKTNAKIEQLKKLACNSGATDGEKQAANAAIERLEQKAREATEQAETTKEVLYTYPVFQANPPRANWHIEKDGVIIAKGNGAFSFHDLPYWVDHMTGNAKDMYRFDTSLNDEQKKDLKKFQSFIAKLEGTVSVKIGNDDGKNAETVYKTVTVTEYKTENTTQETTGTIQQGANFILKANFNYGCYKGLVYHIENIHNTCGKDYVLAFKYNKKLNKLCKGNATQSNVFRISVERLQQWIETGAISLINIVEVKTHYHVEKCIKVEPERKETRTKTTAQDKTQNTDQQPKAVYTYTVAQDTDTRDNSIIYVVKIAEKLTRDDYISVANQLKTIGGYYSKFKHGFIFKTEPTEALKALFNGEQGNNADAMTTDRAQEIADCIIDTSTEIITALGLKHNEYATNQEYIARLSAYCDTVKINQTVIDKLEYDGLKTVVQNIMNSKREQETIEQQEKNKAVLREKINKQIESAQSKIDSLSGDYKINTNKRMREQEGREQKINGFRIDIELMQYLLDMMEQRELTTIETALINGTFRDEIHAYYLRHKAFNSENRPSATMEITFPQVNLQYDKENWWNKEVPKRQKRLAKAGIMNTNELITAAEQYGAIFEAVHEHSSPLQQKIKKMEREARMNQKGDINFTPSEIAKQLVQYAHITENSRVLEPSAGIGGIADAIKHRTNNIDVVERMSSFREILQLKGYNLVGDDFLDYQTENKYDAIIMNPPFSDEQNHIKHAFELLKDGGTLVSITSPHWTFASDRNSMEFRSWVENETSFTLDLPSGTFERTGVASKILVIEKNASSEQISA